MNPVIKAIIAVLIISIGHLIVVGYYLRYYKRAKRLRQEAEATGLSFTPSMDIDSLDAVGHFVLFSKGKTRQVSNVFQGNVHGVDVMMFDYRHFTRGVPGSARRYTVVFFHSDRLNLPPFILGPPRNSPGLTLFSPFSLITDSGRSPVVPILSRILPNPLHINIL